MAVTATFAVLAAVSNALASVLQRKGARGESDEASISVRVLWNLAHKPSWIGGVTAILVGFALQVAALATGPLALVQPILVAELGFTLVLSSLVLRAKLRLREWTAVLGMSAGIALLLVALSPSSADSRDVAGPVWALGSAVALAVIGTLLVLGYRNRYAHRAAYFGVACGIYFGFLAALIAGVTPSFVGGVGAVFTTWQTYAVLVAGPVGFFLLQITLRSGSLVASQPGLTLANPLFGVAWGVAVFNEQVRDGGWIAAQVVGAALVVACTLLLVRSPLLRGSHGAQEEADGVAETGPDGAGGADSFDGAGSRADSRADRNQSSH